MTSDQWQEFTYLKLSQTESVARVPHECEICNTTINVGEKYIRQVGIYDGDFQTYKTHWCCLLSMDCKHLNKEEEVTSDQ